MSITFSIVRKFIVVAVLTAACVIVWTPRARAFSPSCEDVLCTYAQMQNECPQMSYPTMTLCGYTADENACYDCATNFYNRWIHNCRPCDPNDPTDCGSC